MSYTYDYPRPALTVDCVIFGTIPNQETEVLLIQRKSEPFQGKWALPGGFIDENENAEQAAKRELLEETGLEQENIYQFYTFSTPGRDPRGWTVSVAYWALVNKHDCQVQAGDDAQEVDWFPISKLPELAFDHDEILKKAIQILQMETPNL